MTALRPDVVTQELIHQALKHYERSKDFEINAQKIENAVGKGENFMGDLVSVKFNARYRLQEDFKFYHWIVKIIRTGEGFNETRFLDNFEKETQIYKVSKFILTFMSMDFDVLKLFRI